ncbi:endonuclease III [Mycobacterium sp. MAA66]
MRPAMATEHKLAARLIAAAGTTYAEDAGITIRNKPMPLFELLSLCMLAGKPVAASTAAAAARELFRRGLRTPVAVLAANRRQLIEAFGRAGYARYDESSATRMTGLATRVRDEYAGDLRNLAAEAEHDVASATSALQRFDGIGHTGSGIFLREVQDVWPWVRPYFDDRALAAAKTLGLPTDPRVLSALAPHQSTRLAAALVRAGVDELRGRIGA